MDSPTVFFILYCFFFLLAIRNSFPRYGRYLRAWRVCTALLLLGLLNFLWYGLIGSSVDEEGILREPFFLIVNGSFLCISGIFVALVLLLLSLKNSVFQR